MSTSAALLVMGCRSKPSPAPADAASASPLPTASVSHAPPPAIASAPAPTLSAVTSVAGSSSGAAPLVSAVPPSLGPHEVFLGKAAHVALGALGAVAVTRDDEVVLAPMRGGTIQPFPTTLADSPTLPVAVVDGEPSAVYWISRGRLVRRKIGADLAVQGMEVLARDAADGSRLSAARPEGSVDNDVVLYISREVSKELERAPRLWVDKHGSRRVSTEAGGATSVTVVGLGGSRFALLTLDGRVAMSPVHAISLELDAQGAPHLGEDKVVFVAGPAERRTSISGVRVGLGPVALLPMSKDTTQFGLLTLLIGYGDGEAPSSWVDYPNGLDPAPAVPVTTCVKPRVVFVRPETSAPGSWRVLEIGRVSSDGKVVDVQPLARAAAIREVATWAPTGPRAVGDATSAGWVAFVSDAGVIARPLSCE